MLSTVDVVDGMLTTHCSTPFENTEDIDMTKGVSGPDSDIVVPERPDVVEKSKPVKVSAKQLLSRHSELLNYFTVSSANRIALKYPYGEFAYRFHPDVLQELQLFAASWPNSEQIQVVAGLLSAKSGSRNPMTDVEEIFCSLLGTTSFPLPFVLSDIGDFVSVTIGEWSWRIFQCHSLDTFPQNIRAKMSIDRDRRYLGFGLLQLVLDQELNRSPVTLSVEDPSKSDLSMTPRKDLSAKEESTKKSKKISTVSAQPSPLTASLPKISSFFSVVKKAAAMDKVCNDFFPPFQLRPNASMAKINQFIESRTISRPSSSTKISASFKHVLGAFKVRRCICYGADGNVTRAVWKLLQFREDYRPPYYGTWTKKSNTINGRRPFAKDIQSMDYEYYSEAEWVEGALECDEDGESITGTDEEEDEEEDDEMAESEDDGWLVPDGYLSEGEGVDEPLPDHLQPDFDPGLAQAREKEKPKQKRKLVVLKVRINGPWITNGPLWSTFDESISANLDPFQGADLLFKPPEFNLTVDMIEYIKDDLEQNAKLEVLVDKLNHKFGKLPKRHLERALSSLLNSKNSVIHEELGHAEMEPQLQ